MLRYNGTTVCVTHRESKRRERASESETARATVTTKEGGRGRERERERGREQLDNTFPQRTPTENFYFDDLSMTEKECFNVPKPMGVGRGGSE